MKSIRKDGTQSIQRAIEIIRVVSCDEGQGRRLSAIAREVGFHLATVRRILLVLTDAGLLAYDSKHKTYHPGHELHRMGRNAQKYQIRDQYRYVMERIADQTKDSVYLVTRSGFDSICLDIVEGVTDIRIMSYSVNHRTPLGIGAGSLALFSFQTNEQIETILDINALRYSDYYNRNKSQIWDAIKNAQRLGFTVSKGLYVKGVIGVGVPIYNQEPEPIAALSVCAIADRMDDSRQKSIAQSIRKELTVLHGYDPSVASTGR